LSVVLSFRRSIIHQAFSKMANIKMDIRRKRKESLFVWPVLSFGLNSNTIMPGKQT